ncbi:zinc finger protein 239 [Anabrus simplex]|uniref:zinc finger protein 239 n=1 Tax=Anabrus simplex TaxID=316456 RepID=UPI0035A2EE06
MDEIESLVKSDRRVIPLNACRVCLWTSNPSLFLFGAECEKNRTKEKYTEILSYPVEKDDGRPYNVCVSCSYHLELLYEFVLMARSSHNKAGDFKDVRGHLSESEQIEKVDNDPSENVVPNSNNTSPMQNDVPGCERYENTECNGSIFIEQVNVDGDENGSMIFESVDINSIAEHVDSMEDSSIFTEKQNGDSIENSSIIIDYTASQVNDDNNNTDSCPHQNTNNNTGGVSKQEIENGDDVGSTSASLENQRAAVGSESDPNRSAGLPSNTSNSEVIKSAGKKMPQFSCSKCPEKFFSKLQLELHYCNSLLSPSDISCRYCQRKFSDRTELSAHKKVHLANFPESCRKCGEVFVSFSALKVHKKSECIVLGGSRPSTPVAVIYECRICNRDFSSSSGRKLHKTSKEHRANVAKYSLKMKASRNGRVGYKKTDQEINNGTNNVPNSHPVIDSNGKADQEINNGTNNVPNSHPVINGNAKTDQEINNGTNNVPNSHPVIDTDVEAVLSRFNSEQKNNGAQTRYPRIRRRTYSDSVWVIG